MHARQFLKQGSMQTYICGMTILYFDPGLGALIVQGLVAALAGIVLFSKNVKYKLMALFGMQPKERQDIDIEEDDVDDVSK